MTTRHRAPNGRFVAERTTTTTHSVTERLTIEEHHDDTLTDLSPLPPSAPGWDGISWARVTQGTGQRYRAQRAAQVTRCLDHLMVWDESAPPGEALPESWLREAVTILRAGPGASPMELERGRSA